MRLSVQFTNTWTSETFTRWDFGHNFVIVCLTEILEGWGISITLTMFTYEYKALSYLKNNY